MSHLSLVIKLSLDPENESEAELREIYEGNKAATRLSLPPEVFIIQRVTDALTLVSYITDKLGN